MELGKLAFLLLAGGVVGGALTFFVGNLASPPDTEPSAAEETARTPETSEDLELEAELTLLRQRLEEALIREQKLRAQLPHPGPADGPATRDARQGSVPFQKRGPRSIELGSVDEANGVALQLMANRDIEGLWLLGGALLDQGEEGYQKLIELMAWVQENEKEFQNSLELWHTEEVFLGSFFRDLADRHEELLRFGLYLDGVGRERLPEPLREFHQELNDEMGAALLGFYQGNDPEILDGYTDFFGARMADSSNTRVVRKAALALSQIPTDAATDQLLDALKTASPRVQRDVIPALAWQGSERALPVLRQLRVTTQDERLVRLIESAIRFLESR